MARTPLQKLSDRQEKDAADFYNGTVQPGSGSGWLHRQDVKSKQFLVECKRSGKKSITIKATDWEQLRKEAILSDHDPIMDIELDGRKYAMLPRDDLRDLLGRD